MNPGQKAAFTAEMAQAKALLADAAFDAAFRHLQRAHVIGQTFVIAHVQTHAWMFRLELRRHQWTAAAGQVVRIVLGAIGSALGRVPIGNTGGSDVNMFRRMPVDPELQQLIDGGNDDRDA